MKKVITTWNRKGNCGVTYEVDGVRGAVELQIKWYFAIEKQDEQKARELLEKTKYRFHIEEDPKFPQFVKIYCSDIFEGSYTQSKSEVVVYLHDKGIQTYEGDVLNDKRWYVDTNITISDQFKKLYYDIETDDTTPYIEIGRDRILSFAAVGSDGKTYYHQLKTLTDDSERILLMEFLTVIKDYDILLGWNTSQFDKPYLRARMRKFGIHFENAYKNWSHVANYDLLKRMRHAYRFDSQLRTFNLDYISKHFLNKGKIPHEEKIIELYLNNKKLLKEYNLEDCILVKELDEKLGISDMMIKQSSWCGVPPIHFGLYSIIDTYILKTAHSIGRFGKTSVKAITERDIDRERTIENPDDAQTEGNKYIGALVLEPKIGKYKKVYTFDFKSLYPSMMQTSNIGYDSIQYAKTENCIVNPGTINIPRSDGKIKPTYFSKDMSVINLAITQLLKRRTEYKNLKLKLIEEGKNSGPEWDKVCSDEIVVKELSNSTYGIMGLSYGRYYSIDVAESITLFGQWCIRFAEKHFNDRGYSVIYGDTDSVFVDTKGKILDLDEELKIFHESLKKELKIYNIEDVHIQLNFDKEYDGFILIEKKTYVGNVVNTEGKKSNYMYARGLDYVKKSTFSFASKKQKELIEYILKDPTFDEVRSWMKSARDEFMTKEFSVKDLTLMQRVGRPLDTYKTKTPPAHVRLAKEIEASLGKVSRGTEIEYIVVNSKPGTPIEVKTVHNFDGRYDKAYYWENKTLPTLNRILEPIFGEIDMFETQLSLF